MTEEERVREEWGKTHGGSDLVLQHVVRQPRRLWWLSSRRCRLVGFSGIPTRHTYSGMFANLDGFTRCPYDDSLPQWSPGSVLLSISDAEITVMLLASHKVTAFFSRKHDCDCSRTLTKEMFSTQTAVFARPNHRGFEQHKDVLSCTS